MKLTTERTAKFVSTPDPWGGRTSVWAVGPSGLRDALRVLLGCYDAQIVVSKHPPGSFAVHEEERVLE
jgi:hypothetical protein